MFSLASFINMIGCFVKYAVSSVENAANLEWCMDERQWYEPALGCYLDWATLEAMALTAFADCLAL